MAGGENLGVADTLTPAQHFSARSPSTKPRPVGRIHARARRRAHLFSPAIPRMRRFFQDVRQRLGPIDLALLPIGAYEPRWFMQAVHMNPAEAVQAHLDLEASQSIGMHFGTFPMTTEGIDEPLRALEQAASREEHPAIAVSDAWFRRVRAARVAVNHRRRIPSNG